MVVDENLCVVKKNILVWYVKCVLRQYINQLVRKYLCKHLKMVMKHMIQ